MTSMLSVYEVSRPLDDYDVAGWQAYWAANPDMRRGLSADAVDDAKLEDVDADADADSDVGAGAGAGDDDVTAIKAEAAKAKAEAAKIAKAQARDAKAAKEAREQLAALQEQLKAFEGIDPSVAREMIEKQTKAEEEAQLKRGEFESIRKQMQEKHAKELETRDQKFNEVNGQLTEKLTKMEALVEELTVGSKFSSSEFVQKDLVMPSSVTREVFGKYFDVVDGNIVGYNKPRGAADRAPLVDGSGASLGFDDAIKAIVETHPDKDRMIRAKITPGAGGKPGRGDSEPAKPNLRGRERLAAILAQRK